MASKVRASFRAHVRGLTHEVELFKALSDPHRLRLLSILSRAKGDVCVCDLNEAVPLLQPTVSHHLRVLKDAGLVVGQRRATWVFYRLADRARDRLKEAFETAIPDGVPA